MNGLWRRLSHESRAMALLLAAGLPGLVAVAVLLVVGGYSAKAQWTVGLVCGGVWLSLAFTLRDMVARPLQTIANLLMAVREGDYSMRGNKTERGALGEAVAEVNSVVTMLRERRLEEAEAAALLTQIMADVDIALFAWDSDARLRLVNRAGAKLLQRPAEVLQGQTAAALGLAGVLDGDPVRTVALELPGGAGAWELRRGSFRQGGRPHELVMLTDVRRVLRNEEREAWKRLIRVLGHEINNSLAPIQSLSGSLQTILKRADRPEDWTSDVSQGLSVIERRAEGLGRFMSAYTRLARLPAPTRRPLAVAEWVNRVAALEQRMVVKVHPGPDVTLTVDGDQLDQLLINLVRNAVDAALETKGGVDVGWRIGAGVELWVRDEGQGLSDTANLFVPFFTTKPGGSGIGLALAREIAEAHGGAVELRNRADRAGCEAVVTLPTGAAPSPK